MSLQKKIKRSVVYRKLQLMNPQKKKIFFITSFLLLISFMSIGFSYLITTLTTQAQVSIANANTVLINNISTTTSDGINEFNPTYSDNDATLSAVLPNLDSTISYQITFKNYSLNKYKFKQYIENIYANDNIEYTISNLSTSTIINSSDTVTATITFKYKETVTTLPEDSSSNLSITFLFETYSDENAANYVSDDMLLNLRAIDAPVSNSWIDQANGHAITLNNVAYNSENKYYDFSDSSSYGTLGDAIIPQTGDFTLEAYVILPDTFTNSEDEAIIAQVNDSSSNEAGRFKLNFKYYNGSESLVLFTNPGSTSYTYTFQSGVLTSTPYLMQLVRSGSTLQFYINGSLVRTENYAATNIISPGTFKLGRWKSNANQHFTGKINAVRLYNKALTSTDLLNNYQVDQILYSKSVTSSSSLKNYAINNQLVTTGDGLYSDANGNYIYKGNSVNNYLSFVNDSNVYRIVSFSSDGNIELVDATTAYNTAFDASGNRNSTTSTYCTSANNIADSSTGEYYGCNAWMSSTSFSGGTVNNDSTLKQYLNTYYDNMATLTKSKLVAHTFNAGLVSEGSSITTAQSEASAVTWTGNVGLLDIVEILKSSNSGVATITANQLSSSYLLGLANESNQYWTMNGSSGNTFDVWTVSYGRMIGKKRASRLTQVNGSTTTSFIAKPVFYVNGNIKISGTGSSTDPFIVST